MNQIDKKLSPTEVEKIEYIYLTQFYHFLNFAKKRMLEGFNTKEKIKSDWIKEWAPKKEGKGISTFAVGAERVVYALFNSQGFGQPNSSPVGSDLFFETEDAFIHIDMKTAQTTNIGDYNSSIFVGNNQSSYNSEIKKLVNVKGDSFSPKQFYKPSLPAFYSFKNKVCLTYFITILYDEENLDTLSINLLCMPNGSLHDVYGTDVLQAGKNKGKARYSFSRVDEFRLLVGSPKRVKVIYFNEKMKDKYSSRLGYIKSLYNLQKDS